MGYRPLKRKGTDMPPQNKIFRAIVAINSIGFEICYGNYMISPDRNGVEVILQDILLRQWGKSLGLQVYPPGLKIFNCNLINHVCPVAETKG